MSANLPPTSASTGASFGASHRPRRLASRISSISVTCFLAIFSLFLGWMTPRRQVHHLAALETKARARALKMHGNTDRQNSDGLTKAEDTEENLYSRWEAFRDGLIRRWTNLNIVVSDLFRV